MDEPEYGAGAAVINALVTAALEPGLRSVLCLDAAPAAVLETAGILAHLIREVDGTDVRTVVLGSGETDEDLWGGLALVRGEDGAVPALLPGPLGPPPNGTSQLVVIPELPRLGLAGARAAVALLGGQVAHLERYGRSLVWQPGTTAWIAGCAREAAGSVSPHLLDRFALRVGFSRENRADRRAWLRTALAAGPDVSCRPGPAPDEETLTRLRHASAIVPTVRTDAIDAVMDMADQRAPGARRAIALVRVAVACARMAGASEVTPQHVEVADAMLRAPGPNLPQAPDRSPDRVTERADRPAAEPADRTIRAGDGPAGETVQEPIHGPDAPEALDATDIQLADGAGAPPSNYPEDHARVDRGPESLRPAPSVRGPAARSGGVPVGIQQATRLHDIALTSTVVEAIKWRRIRQGSKAGLSGAQLMISPHDLRSYRRAPVANEMLVLVLDYTCPGEWKWPEVLLPYLRWGYTQRASVCLVRVGAADAACSLSADRLMARNMLDPRIGPALEAGSGNATPLAHGLELARQALRHALHHSRAGISGAQLVVVTDGRGNVPLTASLGGRTTGPVGREGVDDALTVAAQVAVLDKVAVTLVDPEPAALADLPRDLAMALGAGIVPVRSLVAGGVAVAA